MTVSLDEIKSTIMAKGGLARTNKFLIELFLSYKFTNVNFKSKNENIVYKNNDISFTNYNYFF